MRTKLVLTALGVITGSFLGCFLDVKQGPDVKRSSFGDDSGVVLKTPFSPFPNDSIYPHLLGGEGVYDDTLKDAPALPDSFKSMLKFKRGIAFKLQQNKSDIGNHIQGKFHIDPSEIQDTSSPVILAQFDSGKVYVLGTIFSMDSVGRIPFRINTSTKNNANAALPKASVNPGTTSLKIYLCEMSVISQGNAPVVLYENGKKSDTIVVFVHGINAEYSFWKNANVTGAFSEYNHLYVSYNYDLPIWYNGTQLNESLSKYLLKLNSAKTIIIVAHSMGGLVARKAMDEARISNAEWLAKVKSVVLLSSPSDGGKFYHASFNFAYEAIGTINPPLLTTLAVSKRGLLDLKYGYMNNDGEHQWKYATNNKTPVPRVLGVNYRGVVVEDDPFVETESALDIKDGGRLNYDDLKFININYRELKSIECIEGPFEEKERIEVQSSEFFIFNVKSNPGLPSLHSSWASLDVQFLISAWTGLRPTRPTKPNIIIDKNGDAIIGSQDLNASFTRLIGYRKSSDPIENEKLTKASRISGLGKNDDYIFRAYNAHGCIKSMPSDETLDGRKRGYCEDGRTLKYRAEIDSNSLFDGLYEYYNCVSELLESTSYYKHGVLDGPIKFYAVATHQFMGIIGSDTPIDYSKLIRNEYSGTAIDGYLENVPNIAGCCFDKGHIRREDYENWCGIGGDPKYRGEAKFEYGVFSYYGVEASCETGKTKRIVKVESNMWNQKDTQYCDDGSIQSSSYYDFQSNKKEIIQSTCPKVSP